MAPETPAWSIRLLTLVAALGPSAGTAPDATGAAPDAVREEAWLLLNSSIHMKLRAIAPALGRFDPADLADIAAQKSLELLRRAEEGAWNVGGRSAGELAGFLGQVARHGLVDHLRRRERDVQPAAAGDDDGGRSGGRAGPDLDAQPARGPAPDAAVERREFAAALRACAGELSERSRTIWLLRVFYELPSREIAAHPEIRLQPGHVDVLLQRAREALRACMERKGFAPREMPPGTFAALWRAFRMGGRPAPEGGKR